MSRDPSHKSPSPSADLPLPPTESRPSTTCDALTRDGRPCPTKPVLGLTRCYAHAPELAEERHHVRVRGGLEATRQRFLATDTPPPSLDSPEAVRRLIAETIHQARTGQLPPNVANAIFYGASVGLRLAELELSAQVAALEQELAARRRGQ